MAYDRVEPIGRSFDRWQMAMLLAITYNANRDTKKSDAASVDDFLPRHARRKPEIQPLEQQLAAIRGSVAPMRLAAEAKKKAKEARKSKDAVRKAKRPSTADPKENS